MDVILRDMAWSATATLFQYACILLFGLFLQLPAISTQRAVRLPVGLLLTAAMLIGQPSLFYTPTTPFGIGNASLCCLAAWSLLSWTFAHPRCRPTVLEVLLSPTMDALQGMIKVHKRAQRHATARAAAAAAAAAAQLCSDPSECNAAAAKAKSSAAARPLVVVDAPADLQLATGSAISTAPPTPTAPQAPCPVPVAAAQPASAAAAAQTQARGLVLQAAIALAGVAAAYDAGLALLCLLSVDMCYNTPSSGIASSGAVQAAAGPHLAHVLSVATATAARCPALALCAFAFAAGLLLQLQMEIMYGTLRLTLLLAGCRWPAAAALAGNLPPCAFRATWRARSISELWGFRWHQFLRAHFEGLAYPAVDLLLLPGGKTVTPPLRASLHTLAAFAMSGAMHEYLTWAAFGTLTGHYMAFFGLHAAAVLLEAWAPTCWQMVRRRLQARALVPGASSQQQQHTDGVCQAAQAGGARQRSAVIVHVPAWLQHAWALSVMVVLGPLFVEPYRAAGYFGPRAYHPLGLRQPVTMLALQWAGQQLGAQLGFAIDGMGP